MSNQEECPRCAPEKRILQELLKSHSRNARNHETFLQGLNSSPNPLLYISDSFSKNVFQKL